MYYLKFRQWDGESWGAWCNCYCYSDPFLIFAFPKYQVRILWGKRYG